MPPEFNAFLPQRFQKVARFLRHNNVWHDMFSARCNACYDRNMSQIPVNFMMNCLITHSRRDDNLLRFAVFPFRDSDLVHIKDQVANTSLHRFFRSANCSKKKLSECLHALVFLRLADRLCQIGFLTY
jgi:hypothetical protein